MFSRRLKDLRLEKGLTQKELAQKLNMQNTAISKYELNERKPDTDILLKIANYFDVSVDYLLGNSDDRTAPNSKKNEASERISGALNDDPELAEFWNSLKDREDLQLLFKQTKDLSPNDVKKIIKIIKAIEDEEDRNDG